MIKTKSREAKRKKARKSGVGGKQVDAEAASRGPSARHYGRPLNANWKWVEYAIAKPPRWEPRCFLTVLVP